jgi:hypothetical protein
VLCIDKALVTILEGLKWRPFSGVGQAIFSLLGTKPEGRKCEVQKRRRPNKMVSTISFIQANLQHSTAASRILTGTVGGKGIDMVLIQEPWFRNGCIRDLNFAGNPLFSVNGADRP